MYRSSISLLFPPFLLLMIYDVHRGGQCTYPCFPGVLLSSNLHIILPNHWLLSHISIVETMDSGLSSILQKNVGRARDRTSALLFSNFVRYRLCYESSAFFFQYKTCVRIHQPFSRTFYVFFSKILLI